METNAEFCRRMEWVEGDVLCGGDDVPADHPKFVRLTAIGESQVLGRPLATNCTEGSEILLELLPWTWRRLSGTEWQSLVDTQAR
ncbi:MAG: hypothetical protein ACKV0T_01905 [Planctomycetales bacterium]